MPRLDELAAFVEVARSLSFTRAADALSLSRPAVSKRIRALEIEVGAPLLKRSTRRVVLTEAGEALLVHVDQATLEIDNGFDAARAAAGSLCGLVRISVPPAYGNSIVLPLVLAFLDLYPGVKVDVDLSERPVDLIAERVDFALRITAIPPPLTSARHIRAIGWRLVASRSYLEKHGAPERPADLMRHRLLLPSAYRTRNDFVFKRVNGEETEKIRFVPSLSITWTDSIGRLVLQDVGIALLPDYLPEMAQDRARVCDLLPQWRLMQGPADDLYALFLPGGRLRAAARALLNFISPQEPPTS